MSDVRASIAVGPGMRGKIEKAVDALLELLNGLDSDPDLEDGGDDELTGDEEPMLGSTTAVHQGRAWSVGNDNCGEPEPSLGWTGVGRGHPQTVMGGYADDREEQHDREHAMTDDNGIADMDGAYEQLPFLNGAGRIE